MLSSAALFDPLPIQAVGARLRAARFAADPAAPPRGVCVLLHGQTEFIEKYFEVIDELRGRGFAVATMDWRGQGGSARALEDPLKSFVGDFSEYDDDLDTLMHWIVAPMLAVGERPIVLAHSMGAHNLLRSLARDPSRFAAGILAAPMIAVSWRGRREWLVRAVTGWSLRRRRGADWVWGMALRDPHRITFATQLVTSDPARFERTQALLREEPDLRLAGATWSWLAAALRAMDWLKAPGRPESITTPLLVVGAGADEICLTPAAADFARRLADGQYVEIAGAAHEILMEQDTYRRTFWAAFDAFIASRRPLGA